MASMVFTVYAVDGERKIASGYAPKLPEGAQVVLATEDWEEAILAGGDMKAQEAGSRSIILPGIRERLALGADDGEDMRLVAVSGTYQARTATARRWVRREIPGAGDIREVAYAGRADSGDPVYLVVYSLKGQ